MSRRLGITRGFGGLQLIGRLLCLALRLKRPVEDESEPCTVGHYVIVLGRHCGGFACAERGCDIRAIDMI